MLYRQIIMMQGIPFQAIIPGPIARDEMDEDAFDAIMQRGLDEVKIGKGRPAADVIADLRKGL